MSIHIEEKLEQVLLEIERIQSLLKQKAKPFLNLEETSKYLGISKATIYQYTHKGIIPFFKLQDRRLYFDINDLNEFVLNPNNRFKSNSEIDQLATDKLIQDRI